MFISFEGIEGSGKSTALELLCAALNSRGTPCLHTREPGGSDLGKNLRGLLLDAEQQIVPEAELFLYLADRAQHVRQVIRPALAKKQLVLSDRYADSTIVYQGYGRRLPIERLLALNELAVGGLWPDMTLLFDLDPTVGLARARARNADLGIEVSEGRFEAEPLLFHQRVREGYLAWAERFPERFHIIDAGHSPREVYTQVENALKAHMP
jgi:dTMP kinase